MDAKDVDALMVGQEQGEEGTSTTPNSLLTCLKDKFSASTKQTLSEERSSGPVVLLLLFLLSQISIISFFLFYCSN